MKKEKEKKGQLSEELKRLRKRVAELEQVETERLSAEQAGKQVEGTLRESEEKYRDLFENARDVIVTFDLRGNVTSVNKAVAEYGFKEDGLVGKNMLKFASKRYWPRLLKELAQIVQGNPVEGEIELITPKGKKIAEYRSNPIRRGEKVVGLQTILRDITERKKAEDALRESEENYRSLVESTENSVYLVDKTCAFLFINNKYLSRLVLPKDKVIGRGYGQFHSEEETKEFAKKIEQVFKTSGSVQYEHKSERDNHYFLRTLSPVKDRDGQITAVTVISKDITEHKMVEKELRERANQLETIGEVGRSLSSILNLDELLSCVVKTIQQSFGYYHVDTFLVDQDYAFFKASSNPVIGERWEEQGRRFKVGEEGMIGWVAQSGEPLLANDISQEPHYIPDELLPETKSELTIPLKLEEQTVGILDVQSNEHNAFNDNDAFVLQTLAAQITVALDNARLYEAVHKELAERTRAQEELRRSYVKLQRTLEETVHALASAVEMRDPYTAGHQRRVTDLACAIATEMGLPQERIEGLRMAGLIHDIGKINVPAEILSKPGPLNTTEFALIKAHPQVGHDILKEIDFPWPVAQIVLQHHERLDGSGYPQGLQGEEMLLEARILAVADVVEAMASRRPYRAAKGIDKALEKISNNKGVRYDSKAVDACLRLFAEDRFHFEE